jgi:hypothetical protein
MGEGKVRYRTSFSPKKSLRFWRGGLSGHIPDSERFFTAQYPDPTFQLVSDPDPV